jgi:hypothetical protein
MKEFSAAQSRLSIAWRELYAVLMSCVIWGNLLTGKLVKFHCDNMSVVSCVNSGSSKCPLIMKLICKLFHTAVKFNFDIRMFHVAGILNIAPDRLSRLNLKAFRLHCPRADLLGAFVPDLGL